MIYYSMLNNNKEKKKMEKLIELQKDQNLVVDEQLMNKLETEINDQVDIFKFNRDSKIEQEN